MASKDEGLRIYLRIGSSSGPVQYRNGGKSRAAPGSVYSDWPAACKTRAARWLSDLDKQGGTMRLSDWQALDARIARKVMSFEQKQSRGEGALFWVSDDGEEYLVERPESHAWMDWDVWQPHKYVAQAMEALEALSQKGVNYSITRFTKAEVIVQLWGYVGGVFCVRRWTNKIMCETICLAIEQWMDANLDTAEKVC